MKHPKDTYQNLMHIIRGRLDVIQSLKSVGIDNYNKAEISAFHGRKIIEGIAFGCMVGIENGLVKIPRDAHGQYNAEKIFKALSKKKIDIFPSPSRIRKPTETETKESNVKAVVEGIPERRITREELIKKYQRMHSWLHELNPYTKEGQEDFYIKHNSTLQTDLEQVELFLSTHFIAIQGNGFVCVLRDKIDGLTKVMPLAKRN